MRYNLLNGLASDEELSSLLLRKPSHHYKVYKIPKRKFGFRVIAQPTEELKNVQRKIVSLLEHRIKIHKSATAYRKKLSIKDNAKIHSNSTYLLKLDLKDFFNSITPDILFNCLNEQNVVLSSYDRIALKELLFWNRTKKEKGKLVLSVGAPSSPFLSNVIMYSFDTEISNYCEEKGINYSRYADDMTFSTLVKGGLFVVPRVVESSLINHFQRNLKINYSKTIFSSKAHNRHITGITLANNNKLTIGRTKKKYVSALVHKAKYKLLDEHDLLHLQGLLSFVGHVEPGFISSLKNKYGSQVILNIKKYSVR